MRESVRGVREVSGSQRRRDRAGKHKLSFWSLLSAISNLSTQTNRAARARGEPRRVHGGARRSFGGETNPLFYPSEPGVRAQTLVFILRLSVFLFKNELHVSAGGSARARVLKDSLPLEVNKHFSHNNQ